jgi:hypothetical protein
MENWIFFSKLKKRCPKSQKMFQFTQFDGIKKFSEIDKLTIKFINISLVTVICSSCFPSATNSAGWPCLCDNRIQVDLTVNDANMSVQFSFRIPHHMPNNEVSPVWVFMRVASVRFSRNSNWGTHAWKIIWNLLSNVAPQSGQTDGFTEPSPHSWQTNGQSLGQ